MAYADYEFYKKQYYGDSIAEATFDKWIDKASRQLDVLTSRRLLSVYPDDEYADQQVKLCVCEIADKLYEVDLYIKAQAVKKDGTAGVIQSKSAGSESVSYAVSEMPYGNLVKNPNELNNQIYLIAKKYLAFVAGSDGVCLLYRGL